MQAQINFVKLNGQKVFMDGGLGLTAVAGACSAVDCEHSLLWVWIFCHPQSEAYEWTASYCLPPALGCKILLYW